MFVSHNYQPNKAVSCQNCSTHCWTLNGKSFLPFNFHGRPIGRNALRYFVCLEVQSQVDEFDFDFHPFGIHKLNNTWIVGSTDHLWKSLYLCIFQFISPFVGNKVTVNDNTPSEMFSTFYVRLYATNSYSAGLDFVFHSFRVYHLSASCVLKSIQSAYAPQIASFVFNE